MQTVHEVIGGYEVRDGDVLVCVTWDRNTAWLLAAAPNLLAALSALMLDDPGECSVLANGAHSSIFGHNIPSTCRACAARAALARARGES